MNNLSSGKDDNRRLKDVKRGHLTLREVPLSPEYNRRLGTHLSTSDPILPGVPLANFSVYNVQNPHQENNVGKQKHRHGVPTGEKVEETRIEDTVEPT